MISSPKCSGKVYLLKHYTNRKEYKAYYEGLFKYTFYNMHSIIEKFNKLQDLILSAKYDTIISRDELNLKFEMTKKEIIKNTNHNIQFGWLQMEDGKLKFQTRQKNLDTV